MRPTPVATAGFCGHTLRAFFKIVVPRPRNQGPLPCCEKRLAGRRRWLIAILLGQSPCRAEGEGAAVRLAANGNGLMPVVHSANASERVKQAARTLADYLARISGGKFDVIASDGQTSIAVGVTGGFPAKLPAIGKAKEPTTSAGLPAALARQGAATSSARPSWPSSTRSGTCSIGWAIGSSSRARRGRSSRRSADLTIAVDRLEHPSYYSRRIWYGFGAWDYNGRSRTPSGARATARPAASPCTRGHAYDGIIARNKAEFAEHPGVPRPGRRRAQVGKVLHLQSRPAQARRGRRAQAVRRASRTQQSISVEPSDGGGWCECDDVRGARQRQRPRADAGQRGRRGRHREVPRQVRRHVRLQPALAAAARSGCIRSVDRQRGHGVHQGRLHGRRAHRRLVGSRAPRSASASTTASTPGTATCPARRAAANLRLPGKRRSRSSTRKGARFLSAESSDNWGPQRPGLLPRRAHAVGRAARPSASTRWSTTSSTRPSARPRSRWPSSTACSTAGKPPLVSDDLLGRMYRAARRSARSLTDDAADPRAARRPDALHALRRAVPDYCDREGRRAAGGLRAADPPRLSHAHDDDGPRQGALPRPAEPRQVA